MGFHTLTTPSKKNQFQIEVFYEHLKNHQKRSNFSQKIAKIHFKFLIKNGPMAYV